MLRLLRWLLGRKSPNASAHPDQPAGKKKSSVSHRLDQGQARHQIDSENKVKRQCQDDLGDPEGLQ